MPQLLHLISIFTFIYKLCFIVFYGCLVLGIVINYFTVTFIIKIIKKSRFCFWLILNLVRLNWVGKYAWNIFECFIKCFNSLWLLLNLLLNAFIIIALISVNCFAILNLLVVIVYLVFKVFIKRWLDFILILLNLLIQFIFINMIWQIIGRGLLIF